MHIICYGTFFSNISGHLEHCVLCICIDPDVSRLISRDTYKFHAGCGGRLSSPSGSIISPGYPAPYHHNAECNWEIHVAKGSQIKFVFLDVDLETSTNCNYDYVKLYDGPDRRSRALGRYCQSTPEPISSTGNSMVVVFKTDYSQGGRGFHARYFIDCNTALAFLPISCLSFVGGFCII